MCWAKDKEKWHTCQNKLINEKTSSYCVISQVERDAFPPNKRKYNKKREKFIT